MNRSHFDGPYNRNMSTFNLIPSPHPADSEDAKLSFDLVLASGETMSPAHEHLIVQAHRICVECLGKRAETLSSTPIWSMVINRTFDASEVMEAEGDALKVMYRDHGPITYTCQLLLWSETQANKVMLALAEI